MKSSAALRTGRLPSLLIRSTVAGAQVAPLRRVADAFIAIHLRGREVHIELLVVGPAKMRAVNRDWRGVDHSTDVLSVEAAVPPSGPVLLGPIVLCPTVAARATTARERSLPYLFAHGLLHCVGRDHRTTAEESAMDRAVRGILKRAAVRVPAHEA